jgi:hypothetical protein
MYIFVNYIVFFFFARILFFINQKKENMKKVFLTLAVVVAMAWGTTKTASAETKCYDYTVNCADGSVHHGTTCVAMTLDHAAFLVGKHCYATR